MATASATFFRQLGGTAGVAVFLSVQFSRVGGSILSQLEQVAADGGLARSVPEGLATPALQQDHDAYGIVRALTDPSTGAPLVAHPFEQGYALSMSEIYLVAGVLA